jgi:hypothetical protein
MSVLLTRYRVLSKLIIASSADGLLDIRLAASRDGLTARYVPAENGRGSWIPLGINRCAQMSPAQDPAGMQWCDKTAQLSATSRWGYIQLSRRSTAQPLYTRFPIIFSSFFPKVTIGYHPTSRDTGAMYMAQGLVRDPDGEQLHLYYMADPMTHGGYAGLPQDVYRNRALMRVDMRVDGCG